MNNKYPIASIGPRPRRRGWRKRNTHGSPIWWRMLLKSLELSIFCSICILRSIFHTRKPLERAISCIFHTIQWIRGLCPGPSDGDPESLNLSLNSEKRTPNSEKNPVMNQAEKHQYGDARNRPAPRDHPGWSRIRRSSRPRAPAPRSCRTMPAAARRVR